MKSLYIIGEKSTAIEIKETAEIFYNKVYDEIFNIVPDIMIQTSDNQIKDTVFLKKIKSGDISGDFIIGLSEPRVKINFKNLLLSLNEVNIIHPNSIIMKSAKIGTGNYIAANSVISSNTIIGDSNIVNFNVSIGHDCRIGSYNTFNPGARISGNVLIGDKVLVGANSFLFQGVCVSNNNLIDAMSYIDRDLSENMMSSSKCNLKSFNRKNIR